MRVPWVVGVSGASGTPYARAVLGALLDAGEPVDLVISRAARLTLLDETGTTVRDAHWKDDVAAWLERDLGDLAYWPAGDLAAGPSSGSYRYARNAGGPGQHGGLRGHRDRPVQGPVAAGGRGQPEGAAASPWSCLGRPR